MYKLCKTEQSAQRQRQLEEGLLTAMRTKRYEEISISDLCDQMGIPRKSFYRYFFGTDGALHALKITVKGHDVKQTVPQDGYAAPSQLMVEVTA